MSTDMHVGVGVDTHALTRRPRITIRLDRFDLYTRIIGATSDEARARLLGVNPRTISRLRQDAHVGEAVIAGTLAAVAQHADALRPLGLGVTFEDLFEVQA